MRNFGETRRSALFAEGRTRDRHMFSRVRVPMLKSLVCAGLPGRPTGETP